MDGFHGNHLEIRLSENEHYFFFFFFFNHFIYTGKYNLAIGQFSLTTSCYNIRDKHQRDIRNREEI